MTLVNIVLEFTAWVVMTVVTVVTIKTEVIEVIVETEFAVLTVETVCKSLHSSNDLKSKTFCFVLQSSAVFTVLTVSYFLQS